MRRRDGLKWASSSHPLTRAPDRAQLIKFAACEGDFNALHFEPDFAQARAIGDNIVHGRFKYAALAQLVSDWLAHDGFVRRTLRFLSRHRIAAATSSRDGRIVGLRKHDGLQIVELELWTENVEGQRTTVGAAEVVRAR
jgi:acyl dehydratase